MRRREFIALFGSTAAAWPLAARAQQPTMPVIGYLTTGSPESEALPLAALRQGLSETGYVETQNVTIQYHWAEFQDDRLPAMAAELVRQRVSVIATLGTPSALAAKAATSTIPIVFYMGIDPVEFGLVASFNHPGGNMTGVRSLIGDLIVKRIEFLHEMLPKAAVVAFLANPNNRYTETETRVLQDGAHSLGLELHVVRARTTSEIDTAFRTLAGLRPDALLVSADFALLSRHEQLVALAAKHALPAIWPWREYVAAGGLVSYGTSLTESCRLVGNYTGRILKGEKPADLPVQQEVKVELIINMKTAKALGLTIQSTLLATADEVIE